MFKAVLSTTVIPNDGLFRIETLSYVPSIEGVLHYVGHPATKEILESLGAVKAPSNLFTGLEVGEQAICFPIQQGLSTRKEEGFNAAHQDVDISKLSVRVMTRVE